ncbi:MAG TPA: TetR/AcrR family transcriptional regulator [Aliidongia sp.]|nr:TetR/AcrR family transcriptional regulator [Aliidongia sp.]
MSGDTKEKLVAAASDLLDEGGQAAVTLRAVAQRVGVSHNAPYRHFDGRSALLAAIAERDFRALADLFAANGAKGLEPRAALRAAGLGLVDYARRHPARYRLLFSDPDLPVGGGALAASAAAAFEAFVLLVLRYRSRRDDLVETVKLAGLLYASLHGRIDLELGGRTKEAKGLGDAAAMLDLLLDLVGG